jgi:hypothetical protein
LAVLSTIKVSLELKGAPAGDDSINWSVKLFVSLGGC